MQPNRLRGYLDALGVLVCEVIGLVLLWRAGTFLGTVDFPHFGTWLKTTSPVGALTALVRLLGIAVFGWLLMSTLLYGAAVLSGKRSMITQSRRITLPLLRRVVDSLAAASVAASTLGSAGAVAGAMPSPAPAPIVQPLIRTAVLHTPTKAAPVPSSTARVSSTATGRHFPHPGAGNHLLPVRGVVGGADPEVPSQANGFAGLPRGTKVVVVQPGDCLSVLAERHLGDWRLDSEIEALNWGRLQPDGRALVDDHWIYVGWVLVMPPDAVGTLVVGEGTSSPPGMSHSDPGPHGAPASHRVVPEATVAAVPGPEATDVGHGAVVAPEPPAAPLPGRARPTPPPTAASAFRLAQGAHSVPDGPGHPGTGLLGTGYSAPNGPTHPFGGQPESAHSMPTGVPEPVASAPATPDARPRKPGSLGWDSDGKTTGRRGDADAAGRIDGGDRDGGDRGSAGTITSGDRSSARRTGASDHSGPPMATAQDRGVADNVAAGVGGTSAADEVGDGHDMSGGVASPSGLSRETSGVVAAGDRGVGGESRNGMGQGLIDLAAAAGIGAITGAGIVWRLDRTRREQSHRRPKGRLIARSRPEVEAAERRVRAIASEEAMRWVDHGMRYLSGLLEQFSLENPGPVPSLALVQAGACGLEIILSPALNRSLGWFSPSDEAATLVLDADVTLEDLEALSVDRWTLWPALVSLGATKGGALLVNLEHAGSLSVEGPQGLVQGVLAHLLVELSSQPWSDEMLSGLYALGDCPLDQHLPGLQIVLNRDAGELAQKLSGISGSHRELAGPFSLASLRAVACEALPNVVVAFAGTPTGLLEHLAETAVSDQSGVAVAGAGPYPGARWELVLSSGGGGLLRGELADHEVSFELALNCDPAEVALLGEALGTAADCYAPTVPAEHGPAAAVPDEGDSDDRRTNGTHFEHADVLTRANPERLERGEAREAMMPQGADVERSALAQGGDVAKSGPPQTGHDERSTLAQGGDVAESAPPQRGDVERSALAQGGDVTESALPQRGDVEICVLGPVDISGGEMGTLEPSRQTAVLALLTYLATHRRPLRADELSSVLWPLDASKDGMGGPQRKTVMNLISRARGVLGYGASGTERLAYSPQGYRLAEEVTSDWERFDRVVAIARQQPPLEAVDSLRAALELVRGEPFGGALSSQFFEWVASEHLDLTITAQVVDAAQDLGQYALDARDFDTVIWAVEKGLQLEPTREELSRLWMHALGRTGRPAKVDDVYRRLKVVLRHRLSALHEPQPETRAVWRSYTEAEPASARGQTVFVSSAPRKSKPK